MDLSILPFLEERLLRSGSAVYSGIIHLDDSVTTHVSASGHRRIVRIDGVSSKYRLLSELGDKHVHT